MRPADVFSVSLILASNNVCYLSLIKLQVACFLAYVVFYEMISETVISVYNVREDDGKTFRLLMALVLSKREQ